MHERDRVSGYFTLFGLRGGGGPMPPLDFAKGGGGHFEVKEGHPIFYK